MNHRWRQRGLAALATAALAMLPAATGDAAWRQRAFVLGGVYTGDPYEPRRLEMLHDAGLNLVINGERTDETGVRLVAATLDSMRRVRQGFDMQAILMYYYPPHEGERILYNHDPVRNRAAMAASLRPERGINRPSVMGWMVWDEPWQEQDFNAIASTLALMDSLPATRDQLGFVNLLPPYVSGQSGFDSLYGSDKLAAYRRYLERFMAIYDRIGLRVPLLCADSYPFELGTPRGDYFAMLGMLRDAARSRSDSAHRVPFWAMVQLAPLAEASGRFHQQPTLAQVRWQVSCAVAYGAKGFLYFTLIPPGRRDRGPGLLDEHGRPTPRIAQLKPFHRELRALGPVLMRLDPVSAWHASVIGQEGIADERVGSPQARSGLVIGLEGGGGDALAGHLRDSRTGEDYLYVVNKNLSATRGFEVVLATEAVRVERVLDEGRSTVIGTRVTRFAASGIAPGQGALFRIVAARSAG